MSINISFELVDSNGYPYKGCGTDIITLTSSISPSATYTIHQLRQMIKNHYPIILADKEPSQLDIYQSWDSFDQGTPLDLKDSISKMINTNPIVSVSSTVQIFVKYQDYETIEVQMDSMNIGVHRLKQAFIESLNSPLKNMFPGNLLLTKSKDGELIDGDVPIGFIWGTNTFTNPVYISVKDSYYSNPEKLNLGNNIINPSFFATAPIGKPKKKTFERDIVYLPVDYPIAISPKVKNEYPSMSDPLSPLNTLKPMESKKETDDLLVGKPIEKSDLIMDFNFGSLTNNFGTSIERLSSKENMKKELADSGKKLNQAVGKSIFGTNNQPQSKELSSMNEKSNDMISNTTTTVKETTHISMNNETIPNFFMNQSPNIIHTKQSPKKSKNPTNSLESTQKQFDLLKKTTTVTTTIGGNSSVTPTSNHINKTESTIKINPKYSFENAPKAFDIMKKNVVSSATSPAPTPISITTQPKKNTTGKQKSIIPLRPPSPTAMDNAINQLKTAEFLVSIGMDPTKSNIDMNTCYQVLQKYKLWRESGGDYKTVYQQHHHQKKEKDDVGTQNKLKLTLSTSSSSSSPEKISHSSSLKSSYHMIETQLPIENSLKHLGFDLFNEAETIGVDDENEEGMDSKKMKRKMKRNSNTNGIYQPTIIPIDDNNKPITADVNSVSPTSLSSQQPYLQKQQQKKQALFELTEKFLDEQGCTHNNSSMESTKVLNVMNNITKAQQKKNKKKH